MSKSLFHYSFAVAGCLAVASAAVAAPKVARSNVGKHATSPKHTAANSGKEKLTIEITGADSAQATEAINKALTDSGLQAKVHEGKGKGKPTHLTAEVDRSADLSQWTKVISATAPKGQAAPTAQFVIYAPLTKETSTQALALLEKVKGIDIKHSTADVKNGEIHVRLTGDEHVSADDISGAVQSAGVAGHFSKPNGKSKTS